jgi:hypothetical protein
MTNCQKCGKELKNDAIRCIHCGSYQDQKNERNDSGKPKDSTSRKKTITIFLFTIFTLLGAAVLIFLVVTVISIIFFGNPIFPNTQSNSVTTTFTTFENQTLGLKIKYPASWNYEVGSDLSSIKFFDPDEISETGIIYFDLASDYHNYAVEDLTKKLTESWQDPKSGENIQIISNKEGILAGLNARELVYTYVGDSGNKYKGIMRITKKGNKLYIVTFTTNEKSFDSFASIVQTMFDSLIITPRYECLSNTEGTGSDRIWNNAWNPSYTWSDGSKTYYRNGVLFVLDTPASGSTFHTFNEDLDNFVVEVDTTTVSGTKNNWQGIEIRQKDKTNFYTFDISADGYYEILKFIDGVPTTLIKPTSSTVINQGIGETNRIKVITDGNKFTFSVNGNIVDTVYDDKFSSGMVSLRVLAPSSGSQSSEVSFDNFKICQT